MIVQGDALTVLQTLPSGSVQTCVTSPPYFGLRDYRVDGQLGLERTPEAYILALAAVFAEVRRVLRADGVLWLNIGDSYAASGRGGGGGSFQNNAMGREISEVNGFRMPPPGYKQKDLIGIPWMLAFTLRTAGWYLRAAPPWVKRNGIPESVLDRPTTSVETVFLFAKSEDYFYDSTATMKVGAITAGTRAAKGGNVRSELKDVNGRPPEYWEYTGTRLRRSSDWFFESFEGLISADDGEPLAFLVNTKPYSGAHFAVFPEALVAPCILAGSRQGDTVCDPFCGSGTVGVVCAKAQREFIGIELNPKYCEMAERRIAAVAPLFTQTATESA